MNINESFDRRPVVEIVDIVQSFLLAMQTGDTVDAGLMFINAELDVDLHPQNVGELFGILHQVVQALAMIVVHDDLPAVHFLGSDDVIRVACDVVRKGLEGRSTP